MSSPVSTQTGSSLRLPAVHLAGHPPNHLFDVKIKDNTIHSIDQHPSNVSPSSSHPLLLPSLCHPHIHLDKAFLLTSNTSFYTDLAPTTGTFQEALSNTSKAKTRFNALDISLRGAQLIAESVQAGVTSMRAFVEIDHAVGTKCIEAAVMLKKRFAKDCFVQICIFAQDPIFTTEHGDYNRTLIEDVLDKYRGEIDVLGTTPYVETSQEKALHNISWAVQKALEKDLHLDFHLDYNLDPNKEATVWDVLRILRDQSWPSKTNNTIVLGHCTRLTLFSDSDMTRLASEIREAKLPVSFIGLPTSDLYMMGRPTAGVDGSSQWERPRGTLQIPTMIKAPYKLSCTLSINNVGNAFTPWGSVDPLRLACLGVGIFHAGTTSDAEVLYECVSTRAKRAIGLESREGLELKKGDKFSMGGPGGWLLFKNDEAEMEMEASGVQVPRRIRRTVQDVVWDPPGVESRKIVRSQ